MSGKLVMVFKGKGVSFWDTLKALLNKAGNTTLGELDEARKINRDSEENPYILHGEELERAVRSRIAGGH